MISGIVGGLHVTSEVRLTLRSYEEDTSMVSHGAGRGYLDGNGIQSHEFRNVLVAYFNDIYSPRIHRN